MTDKKLRQIAMAFTSCILETRGSADMCFAVCSPLATYLNFCRVQCELTEGVINHEGGKWHHYWVTLSDGRIIDPTANQFVKPSGERLKNIWVENLPDDYRPLEIKKGLQKQTQDG